MLGFVRAYEEQTGQDVHMIDYAGGLEQIRSQVRSYNVEWDVVDLELSDALRGCREGILSRIEPALLEPAPDGRSPSEDFIAGSLRQCAVGSVVWSTVIAYDRRAFGKHPPRSLEDFFDPEAFPGTRAMRRTPMGNLEWALMADGVPRSKVYDVLETKAGVERAFRVLNRIKPFVIWWRSGEEAVRYLETGRVSMTTAFNGRIYNAVVERGGPFEILWDRHLWNIELWAIPARNNQREAALEFIRFATSTKSLVAQTRYIPYGPVRRSALEHVPKEVQPHLPTAPQNLPQGLQLDAEWWTRYFERLKWRFEHWLERPVRVPKSHPR